MSETTSAFARFLRDARERRKLSLRAVEDATGVSNAYLSQLEHGRIRQPSPVILHKLCKLYRVSYPEAMRLAGYPASKLGRTEGIESAKRPLSRFENVTSEEEHALAEYLDFLRTRRGSR
jgi:transcriptional regulator with XRE-family HTH domain